MSALTILTKIPWGKIVQYGPVIVDMAEKIFDKLKETLGKQKPPARIKTGDVISMKTLSDRISQLEANELQQAELVSKMTHEIEDVIEALQILSKRVVLALFLSLAAFLTSFIAIILVLKK
jgi:hypothetical protein